MRKRLIQGALVGGLLVVLGACAPRATAPAPSSGVATAPAQAAPSASAPARVLDQEVRVRMAALLARFAKVVQKALREETGASDLTVDPVEVWVSIAPTGGSTERFMSQVYQGDRLAVMAIAEHKGDRIAMDLYHASGQIARRGEPVKPYDLVLITAKGRFGVQARVAKCVRADGCAVGIAVARIHTASMEEGRGSPVSVPINEDLIPSDLWSEE